MNPMATSKEEILKTSRVLIQQNGWGAVNIRAVAAACGVSVGCIYNYFGSKTELVSAAVESIWSDIFRRWVLCSRVRTTASSRCGRPGSTSWMR